MKTTIFIKTDKTSQFDTQGFLGQDLSRMNLEILNPNLSKKNKNFLKNFSKNRDL